MADLINKYHELVINELDEQLSELTMRVNQRRAITKLIVDGLMASDNEATQDFAKAFEEQQKLIDRLMKTIVVMRKISF